MRRALVAVAIALLLLPSTAAAQSQGPSRLWDVFPLREGEAPGGGSTPREDGQPAAPAPDDGSGALPFVLIPVALVLLGGGALLVLRRRPSTARAKEVASLPTPAASPARLAAPAPAPLSTPQALPSIEVVPARGTASRPRTTPARRFVREGEVRGLGYVSVEAVDDSHREDLRRQVTRIRSACDARGILLVEIVPDRESPGPVWDRPGFDRVVRRLERGDATCLVASDVERLASSAEDWIALLRLLEAGSVRLVVADDDLDTASSAGRDEAWSLIGLTAPDRGGLS